MTGAWLDDDGAGVDDDRADAAAGRHSRALREMAETDDLLRLAEAALSDTDGLLRRLRSHLEWGCDRADARDRAAITKAQAALAKIREALQPTSKEE